MHDLTIAAAIAACGVKASIHAQHQMMMMMVKSKGTMSGYVPASDEEEKNGSQKVKMGLLNKFSFYSQEDRDSHR